MLSSAPGGGAELLGIGAMNNNPPPPPRLPLSSFVCGTHRPGVGRASSRGEGWLRFRHLVVSCGAPLARTKLLSPVFLVGGVIYDFFFSPQVLLRRLYISVSMCAYFEVYILGFWGVLGFATRWFGPCSLKNIPTAWVVFFLVGVSLRTLSGIL